MRPGTSRTIFDPAPLMARWDPRLSSHGPGLALALMAERRLRLVVVDLTDGARLTSRDVSELSGDLADPPSAARAADVLQAHRGWFSSLAVADLDGQGDLEIELRAAPPPVVLSPRRPARLVDLSSTDGAPGRVTGGESLVLCSASFLENPPTALGSIRQGPTGPNDISWIRHQLTITQHLGASASVRMPPP